MTTYELPASDHPWIATEFGGEIYLFNEDHRPMTIKDGGLEMTDLSTVLGHPESLFKAPLFPEPS